MDYDKVTIEILKQFKIYNTYKGCDYIVSSICYIHNNSTEFMPITKILYDNIAKQYNTSYQCVEKNIRKVIDRIWKENKNEEIIKRIFGLDISRKPSNMEFLLLLYNYIESTKYSEFIYEMNKGKIKYMCPLNNMPCTFCNDIMHSVILKIFK